MGGEATGRSQSKPPRANTWRAAYEVKKSGGVEAAFAGKSEGMRNNVYVVWPPGGPLRIKSGAVERRTPGETSLRPSARNQNIVENPFFGFFGK